MLELALHVLDIAENSTRAEAKLVSITIWEDPDSDRFRVEIKDDGRGMNQETLQKALDPFYTTKKVRKVGLGLPMLKQAAERCDGCFSIESTEGVGTAVCAEFKESHIDRQPLGDIAGAISILIAGNPDTDFLYIHKYADREFSCDTREIKKEIDNVPINHPEILNFIRISIREGLEELGVKYE